MAVFDNINRSYDAGVAPTLVDYFQRTALENVEPNLGYAADAQKLTQPEHNGKHVHFFRYTELPAITVPLAEGITPDGQKLEETSFSVMTKPYGGFIPFSDEFDLFHIDNKTQAMSERLNRQAKLSLDTVVRDQICTGLNVMYPGAVTSRASLTRSNILTYAEIKKAVRKLKKAGAQPFSDGYYHAKISHDTYYDLASDSHWIDVAKYQDDTRVQKFELGCIYKVKFFEMDNAKEFNGETYLFGTTSSLDASADFDRENKCMTYSSTAITEDIARELTGKLVVVDYAKSTTHYKTDMCIERIDVKNKKVYFRWVPAKSVTDEWTTAQDLCIVPGGGAGNGDPVHATLIYGQDAFGIVGLGKAGAPNIQTIIHAPGGSAEDPLNQRGTVGWKVKHFCAAVIQDDFLVRIEHSVSA